MLFLKIVLQDLKLISQKTNEWLKNVVDIADFSQLAATVANLLIIKLNIHNYYGYGVISTAAIRLKDLWLLANCEM